MAGGSDDDGFFVPGAQFGNGASGAVQAEIDNHIPLPYDRLEVVPHVDLADDLKLRLPRGAREEHLPHATF
jgi:hypothetical protein